MQKCPSPETDGKKKRFSPRQRSPTLFGDSWAYWGPNPSSTLTLLRPEESLGSLLHKSRPPPSVNGPCSHSPEAGGFLISKRTVPESMSRILNLTKSIL